MTFLALFLGAVVALLVVGVPLAPAIERAVLLRRAARRRQDGTLDEELAAVDRTIVDLEEKWAARAGHHGRTAGLGGPGSGTAISNALNRQRAWREALLEVSRQSSVFAGDDPSTD